MYVLDGQTALSDHRRPELWLLRRLGRPLLVLTDPDMAGRQLRAHLDDVLEAGAVAHAFLSPEDATATSATK